MEHELFVCDCGDIEHQLVITKYTDGFYEDSNIYLNVGLRRDYNLLRRVYVAFKYILGLKNNPYHFEVILSPSEQKRLVNILEETVNVRVGSV